MKKTISFILFFITGVTLFAQKLPSYIESQPDAAGIYAIYPGTGVPPGSENWPLHEQTTQSAEGKMVRNVVIPTVTVFKPAEGTANGTAVIVAPGGAFHVLMMDKEGYDAARWLTKLGVTAFVLKYRVQHTPENEADLQAFFHKTFSELPKVSQAEIYPPMSHKGAEEARLWGEEDARQAIRYLRQHASDFGIKADKIGMMGFSAGSGIAVNAALQHDSLSRPNFIGAIYAGYRIISPLPTDLPPIFIAIGDNDKSVAPISSARLYEDWHKTGAWAELHIFSNGDHGFGMGQLNKPTDQWLELFKNWLANQGFLPVKKYQATAPATQPFGAEAFKKSNQTTVRWLGMAGFLVNSRGTTFMVDPLLEGYDMALLMKFPTAVKDVPHVDAIFATHSDNDHYSVPTFHDLSPVTNEYHSTIYVDSLMKNDGLKSFGHGIGDKFSFKGIQVSLTPADHAWQNAYPGTSKRYFMPGDACGFWFNTPDGTIWAPGDSKLMPEQLHMPAPDMILLDYSEDSVWHFGLEGCVKLLNAYPNAQVLLGHWGFVDAPDFSPFNGDPAHLTNLVINPERIHVLAPGQPFTLKRK